MPMTSQSGLDVYKRQIHESVEIGAEKMSVILKADIKRKLKEIGLESGDNVIVHTSLKSMGYVCGGAQAVIEALIETVGENGNDYDADTIVEES